MSTTLLKPLGESSSDGQTKLPAALLTSTSMRPVARDDRRAWLVSMRAAIADVAGAGERVSAGRDDRCHGVGELLAVGVRARRRRRLRTRTIRAIARPKPVPPPVMTTVLPAKRSCAIMEHVSRLGAVRDANTAAAKKAADAFRRRKKSSRRAATRNTVDSGAVEGGDVDAVAAGQERPIRIEGRNVCVKRRNVSVMAP